MMIRLFILVLAALPLSAAGICLQTGPMGGAMDCQGSTLASVEKQLQATFSELKNALNKADRKKLVRAEVAWKQFRDRNCEFQSSAADRLQGDPVSSDCRLRMARQRLVELQRQLESADGRGGTNLALSYRVFVTPSSGGVINLPAATSPLIVAGRGLSFYTTVSGLAPEHVYHYECKISDARGRPVLRERKRLSSGSGRSRELCTANPSTGAYTPGRWSFEVFVNGRRYIHAHRLIHFH